MINVFQLADADKSIYFLGQIFGNVGVALSGTGPTLLANIFKVFNTALLVVGALIVTYTTVVGVMATAQEGEFLGKKWHALWVPLRTLMGIAALFPTKAGYCAIQVVVMWCIVQGIGAADMVWKAAVVYLGKGGSLSPQIDTRSASFSDTAAIGPNLLKQIFNNAACEVAAIKFQNAASPGAADLKTQAVFEDTGVNCPSAPPLSGSCYRFKFGFSKPGATASEQPTWKSCGNVYWQKNNPIAGLETAQTQSMKTVVPVFESLANNFVMGIINDKNCWTDCNTKPNCNYFGKYDAPLFLDPNKIPANCSANADAAWQNLSSYAGTNFLTDATTLLYGYAINFAVEEANAAKNQQTTSGTSITSGANEKAQANGWIFAGAYYYYFAQQNNSTQVDISSFMRYFNFPALQTSDFSTFNAAVQPIYNQASAVMTRAKNAESAANAASGGLKIDVSTGNMSGGGGPAASGVASTGSMTIQHWADLLTSPGTNTNPLISLQQFGHSCLVAAETLFWLFFAAGLVVGIAGAKLTALGTDINPTYNIVQTIWNFLQMPFLFLVGYLLTIGSMLGVYLPLLPYTYFTFGAVGWFLAVIDAMVAAPIVALGILSPGGQHEILGKAEPAAGILLNVCLRPTLMVIGMMTGMLLTNVVILFINGAFLNVVGSMMGNQGIGLFEATIFIMAYASLVMTALTKCFSLIYILPDQILRWIHGPTESFGEKAATEAAGEMKGAAGAAGAAMKGVAAAPGALATAIPAEGQHGEGAEPGMKLEEGGEALEMMPKGGARPAPRKR